MKKNIFIYFAFFLFNAFIPSLAIVIYDAVRVRTGGDTAVVAVVVIGVVFLLSLLFTLIERLRHRKSVDEPVEMISEATKKIASGDFDIVLVPRHSAKRYDDFDVIMANISDMAAQLSKAGTSKADFVSNVSHELKAPLTVLKSYAAALRAEEPGTEERDRYISVIDSTVDKMSALVKNILDLSRLEAQQLSPTPEEVRLQPLLESCLIAYGDAMEKKNIELKCDFEDGVVISSVGSYIELIVNNLVSNAIKFTGENGVIEVTLRAADNGAIVTVKDNGVGISKETGERIFERFYQADTSHKQEGNGLGLAIVKRAIGLLGGEISVESAPDVGSKFCVKIDNMNA